MSASPTPSEISWSGSRFAGDALRTRFRPSRRIRLFFLAVVPWVDMLLLAGCVCFAAYRRTYTPGMRVDLPEAPFQDGARSGLVLVVNPRVGNEGPFVFFDETRYNFATPAGSSKLAKALKARAAASSTDGSADVILFVDRDLPFGDLSELLVLLRAEGLPHVHFATRTP